MAAQEPGLNITVKLTTDLTAAMDAYRDDEEKATGNPVSRSDVIRLALAQYLGIAKRKMPEQPASTEA